VWYFRTPDGERFPVDDKVELVAEGRAHPAVVVAALGESAAFVLDVYDSDWQVGEGTMGDAASPCKILVLQDSFSGARIEVPIQPEQAGKIAQALFPRPERRRLLRRQ
jgi:hypothetical protein